jgi:hypothetical protein
MEKLSNEAANTMRNVRELAACREEYIRKKGWALSLSYACFKIGIQPQAVKRLAPELYEKWTDIDFHW